jgi:PKD domain-containing protein
LILLKRNILIIIACLLFLMGCKKKEPEIIANFSYSLKSKYAPDTVTFSNTSQNADSYFWDFGDTTTSTEVNPVHIYKYPGEFNVKLTARKGNVSQEGTKKITISNWPDVYKIVKAELLPAMDSIISMAWDSLDGPDLSIQVFYPPGFVQPYYSSIHYNVTASDLPLSWTLNPPVQDYIPYYLSNFYGYDHPIEISLLENDSAGVDPNWVPFYVQFDPEQYSYPNGSYPSEVQINPYLRLYLEW